MDTSDELGRELHLPPGDTYSFGMTALEVRVSQFLCPCSPCDFAAQMYTGTAPFAHMRWFELILRPPRHPSQPDVVPDKMWELMQEAWREEPGLRPSMVEVRDRVALIITDEEDLGWRLPWWGCNRPSGSYGVYMAHACANVPSGTCP